MELKVKVSHKIEPNAKNSTRQNYIKKQHEIKALKPMPQNQRDYPLLNNWTQCVHMILEKNIY